MYWFVLRRRGPAFAVFFAGVHFLVNLIIISSVAAGVAQWLVSASFRRTYETGVAAGVGVAG